jgi:GNAT superfamily N-acetyltransferase
MHHQPNRACIFMQCEPGRHDALNCRCGRVWRAAARTESPCGRGYRVFLPGGYIDAVKIRPREAADQAAAQAFLARHNSLRGARLGELVHPLDHPAFVAEAADGHLLGMLTYVPGHDWRQCEILTLHADEQWRGAGTALIEAVGQLARQQGCARLWVPVHIVTSKTQPN